MAKKNNPQRRAAMVTAVACIALVAGTAYYVRTEGQIATAKRATKPAPKAAKADTDVKVYTPRYEDGDLKLDAHEAKVKEGEDPMVFAVNEYIKGLPMVPEAARVIDTRRNGRTVVLNFNKAFATSYGTEDERTVVEGIVTIIGQFKDVDNVLFQVEGKPLESLGNIELTDPQPVLRR